MSLLLALAACSVENTLHDAEDTTTPVDHPPALDDSPLEMSIDVALQRTEWGDQVTRCQIQIAFHSRQPVEDGGAGGQPQDQPVTHIPKVGGLCAHSWLDDGSEPPSEEGQDQDNWQESGSLVGPEALYLHSPERSVELTVQETHDGGVRYEWDGCSDGEFPFGEVFDLEIPAAEGDLPQVYIDEAFGVGPDLRLLEPLPNEGFRLVQSQSEELLGAWALGGEPPRVRGEAMDEETLVFVRNYETGVPGPEFEALACRAGAEEHLIWAGELAELVGNEDADPEGAPTYSSFQVDSIHRSPAFETPWGQLVSVRSTVTEGGTVHLFEESPDTGL